MHHTSKRYVVLSQYESNFHPPFAIILNETDDKEDANKIFNKQADTDETVVLLNTKSNKILRSKGNIERMKIALDKNYSNWHK